MSNLIPQPMTHGELADMLEWVANHVREHDSWEGNIAWQIPDPDAHVIADCEVTAVMRYGNLAGQGSMRIIGTVPTTESTKGQRIGQAWLDEPEPKPKDEQG